MNTTKQKRQLAALMLALGLFAGNAAALDNDPTPEKTVVDCRDPRMAELCVECLPEEDGQITAGDGPRLACCMEEDRSLCDIIPPDPPPQPTRPVRRFYWSYGVSAYFVR